MNRNPHGIPLGIHEEYYSQHKSQIMRLLSNLLNDKQPKCGRAAGMGPKVELNKLGHN